jgi:uncharacterized protein YuzE
VQLSYDPRRNIAYLRLRELSGIQVETVRLSDEVNVDLAADGTVYGIELLNANAQLRNCDDGHFVLFDETRGPSCRSAPARGRLNSTGVRDEQL